MIIRFKKPIISVSVEAEKYLANNAPEGIHVHCHWRNERLLNVVSIHIDPPVKIDYDLQDTIRQWLVSASDNPGCTGDISYDVAHICYQKVTEVLCSGSIRANNGVEFSSRTCAAVPAYSPNRGIMTFTFDRKSQWMDYRSFYGKVERYVEKYLNRFGTMYWGDKFSFPQKPKIEFNEQDRDTWLYPPCE